MTNLDLCSPEYFSFVMIAVLLSAIALLFGTATGRLGSIWIKVMLVSSAFPGLLLLYCYISRMVN